MVYRMCRYVVHRIYLNSEICLKNSTTYDPAIAALPASSSNCQNPPANTPEIGLHVVMPQAAELGADNSRPAHLGGREVNREIQSWNKVLLHPYKLRHIERMTNVLGVNQHVNIAIDGNRHFGGHSVIFGILIVGLIKSKKVSVGRLISAGWSGLNFPSGPG